MEYLEILKDTFLTDDRYMYIVNGVIFSIGITLFSAILGIILGLLLAIMKLSHWYPFKRIKFLENFNPLSKIAYIYIDVIRGTPVVVQLMILANLIFVGALRETPILIIGGIAFGLNSGAYVAEIIRAGIEGLDKGQMEAGRSLGLTWGQTMRYIIMPQAFKAIIPPLGNEFIAMLKDSSLVSVIGFEELTRRGQLIIAKTYASFEIWGTVAVIYLIMTVTISQLVGYLERKYSIK